MKSLNNDTINHMKMDQMQYTNRGVWPITRGIRDAYKFKIISWQCLCRLKIKYLKSFKNHEEILCKESLENPRINHVNDNTTTKKRILQRLIYAEFFKHCLEVHYEKASILCIAFKMLHKIFKEAFLKCCIFKTANTV